MINSLQTGLSSLPLTSDARSRSISAENFTGEKGKGGMAEKGTGEYSARFLGKGWKVSPCVSIQPNETFELASIDGPGIVQSMWFTGDAGNHAILRIYWDGQESPSVEAPLPAFFGNGWVKEFKNVTGGPFFPLNSMPVAVNPSGGLNCFWPMPFRKHCRITMENRSPKPHTCFYQINYSLERVPEEAAYFHAQYRQSFPLPAKEVHTILDGVRGRGQYVGTALFVGLNGTGNWWGEGEVKFYMDGDEYPTICGTGTEDYFGGSYDWEVDGKYTTYSTPFMGMHQCYTPDNLYNHQQRFSMYRWHIMDPIRFTSDLKVTIQDLGWDFTPGTYLPRRDDMASVAYWYQTLPAAAFPRLPAAEEMNVI
ncbi:MAG: DUF2961 domain-containing protein [Defluviitaleaceae bacterium]|nr:DUF2961 domain-containing protein [Defluviitaleaceae bacterium]